MKQRTKMMLHYAKPHKWVFAALFTCIIVTIISGSVYPYIFGMLVDEVFYGKNFSVFLNIVLIEYCIGIRPLMHTFGPPNAS